MGRLLIFDLMKNLRMNSDGFFFRTNHNKMHVKILKFKVRFREVKQMNDGRMYIYV